MKKDLADSTFEDFKAAQIKAEAKMIESAEASLNREAPEVGALVDDALDLFARRADGRAKPIELPWKNVGEALGGGLWPGLHVLVGGTGQGKSQWALQVALEATLRATPTPTLYLALELGQPDVVARLLGLMLRKEKGAPKANWSDLFIGSKPKALEEAKKYAGRLKEIPLRVEVAKPHGWSFNLLYNRVEALRSIYPENNPGELPLLVIVDYLQAVGAPERERVELRERIQRASYEARAAARDFNAAVLLLSSTSRESFERLTKEEEITDETAHRLVGTGKESGDIEYAADTLMVLCPRKQPTDSVKLAIAKVRAGQASCQELEFDGGGFSESIRG